MQGAEERRLSRMGQYGARPTGRREKRSKAASPFDFAQDREPVERPVERQMMP
jgi:hypothetical protein